MKLPLSGRVYVMLDREQQSLVDTCLACGCVSLLPLHLAHAQFSLSQPLYRGPLWWTLGGPRMPTSQSLSAAPGF